MANNTNSIVYGTWNSEKTIYSGSDIKISDNNWHLTSIEFKDNTIYWYVNNKLIIIDDALADTTETYIDFRCFGNGGMNVYNIV